MESGCEDKKLQAFSNYFAAWRSKHTFIFFVYYCNEYRKTE